MSDLKNDFSEHNSISQSPDIRTVTIPAHAEHQGIYIVRIRLSWVCPVCGGPRGEIQNNVASYDGSRRLLCDGWLNPCGHIDKYSFVREEAKQNGLNVVSIPSDTTDWPAYSPTTSHLCYGVAYSDSGCDSFVTSWPRVIAWNGEPCSEVNNG